MPRATGATYGAYRRSYIVPHGSGFKFFRSVPPRYRAAVGKTAWIKCLGDVSRSEAERQVLTLNLAAVRELEALERLSPAQLAELTKAGGRDRWREQVAKVGAWDATAAAFHTLAAGMEPDPDQPGEMQDIDILAAGRARRALKEIETRRASAEHIESLLAGKTEKAPKLFALVDAWQRVRNPARKSILKGRLYFKRLVDVIGDKTPRQVTESDIRAYRDTLAANPKTAASAVKHIEMIKAVFSLAKSEGLVDVNPAKEIKLIKNDKRPPRKGFTAEHARAIFAKLDGELPRLTLSRGARKGQSRVDDFRMIMKLCAYHGARSGEFCQLRCCDVGVEEGVTCLRLTEEGESMSLKNDASARFVPLHPTVRAEFLAYVSAVQRKHGNTAWVFQQIAHDQKNGHGSQFINDASRFIRHDVGIKEACYTMHSWRHRMRTLFRIAKTPITHSTAIMGHDEGRGHHADYGERPPLRELLKELRKIDPLKG